MTHTDPRPCVGRTCKYEISLLLLCYITSQKGFCRCYMTNLVDLNIGKLSCMGQNESGEPLKGTGSSRQKGFEAREGFSVGESLFQYGSPTDTNLTKWSMKTPPVIGHMWHPECLDMRWTGCNIVFVIVLPKHAWLHSKKERLGRD